MNFSGSEIYEFLSPYFVLVSTQYMATHSQESSFYLCSLIVLTVFVSKTPIYFSTSI